MSNKERTWIGLFRGINIGGNRMPMKELVRLMEAEGFTDVKTYIASGNVVFLSHNSEIQVKKALETALAAYAGKPVGVMVRTAAEMAAVAAANPFPDAAPNRTVAIFLDAAAPADALDAATGVNSEKMALGRREIYVHYGDGMADSKLKIPAGKNGTARNLNTIAKLAEMATAL